MRSLEGREVVVTRPREQAEELVALLADRGAVPVLFPTIGVRPADPRPLDRALATLEGYDWVVFASANAARFFGERFAAGGRTGWPARVAVGAVGPATARSLAERGIPVRVVPDEHRGDRLAAALGRLAGARVLLPRADIGREETEDTLRAAGAQVDPVTVYHTVPAAPDATGLRALRRGVDAVTFTSPSTVRNFVTLLGPEAGPCTAGRLLVSIGPVTSAAVVAQGLPAPVEARTTTMASLVEALEEHLPGAGRGREGGVG